jgi:geranylgeranyl transferase type-1 subunit beta
VSRCGFACGPNDGHAFDPNHEIKDSGDFVYFEAHIAMTYSALCVLKILGDDFSRVNKKAIIGALKFLQMENGRLVFFVLKIKFLK